MNDKKNSKWLHNRYGKNLNKMFAFQKAYPMIILNKIGPIYNQSKPSPIRTPSWIGTNTNQSDTDPNIFRQWPEWKKQFQGFVEICIRKIKG